MKRISSTNPVKIEKIYAYVAQNESGEGIIAAEQTINGKSMVLPLVGADLERIKQLYPLAEDISKKTKIPFKIYCFDNKTDITQEIDPLRV